jgi:AraC family transcriptional regulator
MTTPLIQMQPVLAFAASRLDEDVSLDALARSAGLSLFHLHRVFARAAGETPKQYTLRLRVDRAAALLLTTRESVLRIALDCGFQSHEAFSRAFKRRFGMSPTAYRKRGFSCGTDREQAAHHEALVKAVGPCVGLLRRNISRRMANEMEYSITKKALAPQPVLVVRRRVKPDELANALGPAFQTLFLFAQQNALALAGPPLTRYLDWGPGVMTIEPGMPVAAHGSAPADDDIRADTLPGGFAAVTTHTGPYDGLTAAHAAVQQWIEAQGLMAAGGPWELYITDPADFPDPKDWKTEIYWPLA